MVNRKRLSLLCLNMRRDGTQRAFRRGEIDVTASYRLGCAASFHFSASQAPHIQGEERGSQSNVDISQIRTIPWGKVWQLAPKPFFATRMSCTKRAELGNLNVRIHAERIGTGLGGDSLTCASLMG